MNPGKEMPWPGAKKQGTGNRRQKPGACDLTPVTRPQLAKIHIAKKELAMPDDAYRAILRQRYQVDSARELTQSQAQALIDQFRRSGWVPKSRTKRGNDFIVVHRPQQKKVLGMWKDLGYSMAGLHARCKKQFGIDRFEWLIGHDELHILITDLDARLKRRGLR